MDTISIEQLGFLLLLWTGVSLFGGVTTQVVKTPLRIAWKQRAALKGDSAQLYTWTVRLVPIFFCTVFSFQMGVWPAWVRPEWHLVLGATAGCFSVGVYHAAKVAIPKAIGLLPEVLRKRLGG